MKYKIFKDWRELAMPILLGVVLGCVMVAWREGGGEPQRIVQAEELPPSFACAPPPGFTPLACAAEETATLRGRELIAPDVVVPRPPAPPVVRLPFYEKYVPVPKGVHPNSIRLAKSQVHPPIGAKREGGRYVCGKKSDKPGKSDKNKKNHIDMQCCLDPDEIPNPYCTY